MLVANAVRRRVPDVPVRQLSRCTGTAARCSRWLSDVRGELNICRVDRRDHRLRVAHGQVRSRSPEPLTDEEDVNRRVEWGASGKVYELGFRCPIKTALAVGEVSVGARVSVSVADAALTPNTGAIATAKERHQSAQFAMPSSNILRRP